MKKISLTFMLLITSINLFAMSGKHFQETISTSEFGDIFNEAKLPLKDVNKIIIDDTIEISNAQKKEEILQAIRACKYKIIQNSNGQQQKVLELTSLHKLISTEMKQLQRDAKIAGSTGMAAGLVIGGFCIIGGLVYFFEDILSRR